MTHNKFLVAILIFGFVALIIAVNVATTGQVSEVAGAELIKLGNQLFRPVIPTAFALGLLYFFRRRGNEEAEKITSDPIAIAIVIAGIAIAVGISL